MKGLLGIAVVAMCVTSSAGAYTGFGVCNFGKQTVSDVICYGPVILKDTTISGDMKVAGSVKAAGVTIGSMTVAGSVTMESSRVNGVVNIVGSLNTNGVEFVKDLMITSSMVTLTNTKLDGSIKITSEQVKPTLVMQCGTVITGNVTFDSKAGLVQMTDDSSVQGKIVNGTQEFLQKKCS